MHRKRQTRAADISDDDEIFTPSKVILKKLSDIKKSPSKERKLHSEFSDNNVNNKNCDNLKFLLRRSTENSNFKYISCQSSSPSGTVLSTHSEEINTLTAEKLQQSLKITEDENVETQQESNESDDSDISDIDNNPDLKISKRSGAVTKKTMRTPTKKNAIEVDPQTPVTRKKIADNPETPLTRLRSRRCNLSSPKSTQKLFNEEPSTPKRKSVASKTATSLIKLKALTPSIKRRTTNVAKPKTILEEARAQLHVSAVPQSLPCRETEFNDIFMFLEKKIADHSSGCMYISGVPGTGKTATVNEVIRCLKKLNSNGSLPDFDFYEINGMKMSEPRQSYVQILKQMTGQSTTWEAALKILDKRFTNKQAKKSMTLLLIDELDVLCNKRQDVVYNLLNWPSQPAAQLVVITIANTMDLPERVLMSRVTSRLGLTRLTFQPYNYKQLNEIVIARLNESNAFKSEAVQLVARKVAAVSGDARRALDICRRATEIAELYESKIVTIQHVNEALTEMIASVKVRAIKCCSEMEKVFLQAVCAEIKRTGVEETIFKNVYKQIEALCSFEGVFVPNATQALDICNRLCTHRFILVDDPRNDILQRIFLNVSMDDIHFALQDIKI
ncbi:origin recognition complex subunit 1 [Chelonus insularis]|uniref:origin recognition complex subunit 1 n=1 Tax=Chelonus insularis TaxID=460826 RepID=UPI00158EBFD9|nr:origin recognition complex subunit 1 [Chelonus insularis]